MSKKKVKYLACDFETTVYEGQEYTEVWSAAAVEFWTEDVYVLGSIDDFFSYLWSLHTNVCAYFHNLKFDGSFIIDYLIKKGFKQAYQVSKDPETGLSTYKWRDKVFNNEFKYLISNRGQWYQIKVKKYDKTIEFRDSLKLFPFSLRAVGKAFNTKHRKLDMEYEGFRYAGCKISDKEMKYIENDVLVLKEALEFMFAQGHNKLTIGSCCLDEFQIAIGGYKVFDAMYPNLFDMPLDPEIYGQDNAGDWILKAYRGGWCYLVEEKAGRIFGRGVTADVNSLYPSMMQSESGNIYPYGKPTFWNGNYIPDDAIDPARKFFYVRIRTRFRVREGKLPFIQIKGNFLYDPTKSLRTSDVYNRVDGKYYSHYISAVDGMEHDTRQTLTMTMIDYRLFLEHYAVKDFEILGGCWFWAESGQFDCYINKYAKIKQESKGAMRTLAKLFLNNLYGKFASSTNSSFKVAYLRDDNSVNFSDQQEFDKKPGYIAIGAAVTSYARNFTIRAAQKNFYGPDLPGFIYADTDSIHCDLTPSEIAGITVDPVRFNCWKLETTWDEAIFARQKTYIEHVVENDLVPVSEPYYNITCAGMPDNCKELLRESMTAVDLKAYAKRPKDEKEFLKTGRTLWDFRPGLRVPGKLMPKRIPGGVVLVPTDFEMRYYDKNNYRKYHTEGEAEND